MRRILLLVTMALVMAAMMLAMAVPAFAAKPIGLSIVCESPTLHLGGATDEGRIFGEINKFAAQSGHFHGNYCERTVVR